MDSPGDTEIENSLKNFVSKGYLFTKMLVYLINEESLLDDDSLGKNKNLEILIESRAKYKIPLLILLTHSDIYCDKVEKENKEDWKTICKEHFDTNKNNLLSYINELINKEFRYDFKMDESDIIHIVLVEPNPITDEEVIKKFTKRYKEKYGKAKTEEERKGIVEDFKEALCSKDIEALEFLKEEMKALDQKELIEKIREKLPSQYHNAFNSIN